MLPARTLTIAIMLCFALNTSLPPAGSRAGASAAPAPAVVRVVQAQPVPVVPVPLPTPVAASDDRFTPGRDTGTIDTANLPKPVRVAGDISPIETRVLGRNDMLWRAPASLRVIVTDHRTGDPVRRARVEIAIGAAGKDPRSGAKTMYAGRTDSSGTLDATFRALTAQPGPHTLLVDVQSGIGDDSFTQPLQLDQTAQILMTCDKPVYQPGQVIHMRALVRDEGTGAALAGAPVTFEVEDGRGNKVFKDHETLSEFGVASADFQLADEVNMGTFTLRTIEGNDQAEKKVNVSRYVLPKFKVAVATDKSYYLPGQTVTGTIKAAYIFGKPLAGAAVHLSLNTADIGVTEIATLDVVTDDTGSATYSFALPTSFVGQPVDQGKAQVEVDAQVTDTAKQEQDGNVRVPVVESPIVLAVVPESAHLVMGVENRVYIAAATPDGRPITDCAVDATVDGVDASTKLTTDALGLTTFSFTPTAASAKIIVTASDSQGNTTSTNIQLDGTADEGGLILRTDRTLAKVGEKLHLQVLSTGKTGSVYIDVVRDKQTILTQAADIKNGVATLTLPISPDMAGTIELHAYKVMPDENIVRDTRIVLVSPADDLTVTLATDQPQYKPGDDAVLNFTVRDRGGNGVSTALGVAIVDESVFALSELQPGLERVYFTLEKELMDPKYEINGLTPTGLIEQPMPINGPVEIARQRGAAMLLAGAPTADDFDYNTNTYESRYTAFIQKTMQPEMLSSYGLILDALDKYTKETGKPLAVNDSLFSLVRSGDLSIDVLRDHFGHYYRTDSQGQLNYTQWFTLNSAGADGKWGTTDDILGFRAYRVRQADGTYKMSTYDFALEKGNNGMMFGGPRVFMFAAGAVDEDAVAGAPMAAPMPMMAPGALGGAGVENRADDLATNAPGAGGGGQEPPRVRSYFPETMYWNPALITDDNGMAQVELPMADSITTWRVSTMANTSDGLLGSGSAPIKVFQDFFVDMDLPVAMTQNDKVDLPVVVYNYLAVPQDVTVTLTDQPWFVRTGNAGQVVHMAAGDVRSVSFPITVKTIGSHTLTVTAQGTSLSDAVQRPIDVLPDGKEFDTVINDQLSGTVDKTVTIPGDAIPGASHIFVKLFPGAFSQVVDGLDGILRMPGGCFEQTSSSTFPDVLVLDYLKQTHKVNPELQLKADQYINVGYQRLVTFECKSGGFSWFGNEPAHQILTAYGLIEFADMSKVHDVDPALIARTAQWLAGKQKSDGTWEETGQGIAEGIINRQTGGLRTTAYVGWALSEAGYKGPQLASALAYVEQHWSESKDPYTLAVVLNFLDSAYPQGAAASAVAEALVAGAKIDAKTAYWQSDTQTFTGANGTGADLETTGLAAYGLCRYGRAATFTNKVLTYLVQSKDSFGTWESTQGTVWSLKALLYAGQHSSGGGAGTVTVSANGQPLQTITLTADDSDVMRQVDLGSLVKGGDNDITLTYAGEGGPMYQIVGRYFVPWSDVPAAPDQTEPLSIKVAYDKTQLSAGDTATATVTVHNNTDETAEMPLIDLGVPAGFTVNTDRLEALKSAGSIDKYTVAARQIIVYMTKLDPNATVTVTYQLIAKYPIRVRTPMSKVYPYYNPEKLSISSPQDLVVE